MTCNSHPSAPIASLHPMTKTLVNHATGRLLLPHLSSQNICSTRCNLGYDNVVRDLSWFAPTAPCLQRCCKAPKLKPGDYKLLKLSLSGFFTRSVRVLPWRFSLLDTVIQMRSIIAVVLVDGSFRFTFFTQRSGWRTVALAIDTIIVTKVKYAGVMDC